MSHIPFKLLLAFTVLLFTLPAFAAEKDIARLQLEGGILYELAATLKGEITIKRGAVEQSNFHEFELLRIDETPEMEIHIVESDEPPGGAGEPGLPPVAPAVANAIFDATGKRIRKLPIRPEDLRA